MFFSARNKIHLGSSTKKYKDDSKYLGVQSSMMMIKDRWKEKKEREERLSLSLLESDWKVFRTESDGDI